MARELKPCGTFAAYMRHIRAKEEPCSACRQAARDQRSDRHKTRAGLREKVGATVDRAAPVVGLVRPGDDSDLTLEPVDVALQDLRQIEAYMHTGDVLLPQHFVSLSRRREELLDRVRSLQGADEGGDELDELAAKREARSAAASN